ncbi:MAG: UDP-N-acetylglucosamine--N-acetylmuramyl-(pentapeptide) pyrophosphoryl-undecaprenol N-acetylglucosamine transferase [Gemmatimonadota bacterium]|jgi:UDP-N-acetylglucosamine--N-acetylmuramyl-(pentapeptide) pyrophosphoryl-undecaprenol N-acetylglucosamine transferase|nr:UDP-N-acetylglucosamine--N-acetylmuramyl-(pentapeptide) pyrophosphoryl-undecaprenol N-acetylglucosamine transferase [Gemmatimonadota bacterium]MDP6802345.1 UDP-N-acetylglucosamine--N-acetylmuramyl-(pentapeptide) pyrophosphoryl-undecaprenol N-acetylglucosamine transferase [Gemmatimonadota bacterium]MDP7032475.1 UDP-N-acetylglucosamine--N-acetylmuramyl-(pentapeptide) pyrophosphoryl-undecaprenol N-acetylglucosamine transferase [Gemmatimonadota bacterium]
MNGGVLIAASGTGGHIYPGIALAEELTAKQQGVSVRFAVASGKPGAEWIRQAGFEPDFVRMRGLARRPGWSWLTLPYYLVAGFLDTWRLLRRVRPKVVVGTGGYVSGPFVFLAWVMRIPALVLEQNRLPGVATRISSLFATEVHVSDAVAMTRLPRRSRARVTGTPVRRSVEEGDGERFLTELGLSANGRVVLVLGGSQGARAVAHAAFGVARDGKTCEGVSWIIQTGDRGFGLDSTAAEPLPESVRTVPFIEAIGDAYAAADLVVARAGATTLAELSAAGVPAVLVPFPFAAGGHQMENAREREAAGAARVLPEEDLTTESLGRLVERLLRDAPTREAMSRACRAESRSSARSVLALACQRFLEKQGG